jgi:hypothetical protein
VIDEPQIFGDMRDHRRYVRLKKPDLVIMITVHRYAHWCIDMHVARRAVIGMSDRISRSFMPLLWADRPPGHVVHRHHATPHLVGLQRAGRAL